MLNLSGWVIWRILEIRNRLAGVEPNIPQKKMFQ